MALVLTGANSYTVVHTDDSGIPRRVNILRGQSVDGLNLGAEQVEKLKTLSVRGAARRVVPMFTELDHVPGPHHRHSVGGKISNDRMKAQKEASDAAVEAAVEVEVVAEAEVTEVAEAVAEPVVEEAPKEEPAKKAPAKKAKKSKKTKK